MTFNFLAKDFVGHKWNDNGEIINKPQFNVTWKIPFLTYLSI